ncbi:HAMP domain-containing sensor histidine kinase [Gorillibacterium sp. CAU 1737]|uniref:HAMP domain-containing sensor histidine kinase n=1 Tax=Gorillibacterium sp. CAU 1737 TaxID=3140362 RepID=UPI00326120C2
MTPVFAASDQEDTTITKWKMKWVGESEEQGSVPSELDPKWFLVSPTDPIPVRPEGVKGAWIQFHVPAVTGQTEVVHFPRVYAMNLEVYLDGHSVLQLTRHSYYTRNSFSVPIALSDSNKTLSMWIEPSPQLHQLGLAKPAKIMSVNENQHNLIRETALDFSISGGLAILGLASIVAGLIQGRQHREIWIYLGVFLLCSSAVMAINTYELYVASTSYYKMVVFDISLLSGLFALLAFYETTLGSGKFNTIRTAKRFQLVYLAIVSPLSVLNLFFESELSKIYYPLSTKILALVMIIHFSLMILNAFFIARKGRMEAIVFSVGFVIFAMVGAGEMIGFSFFKEFDYQPHLWKWGLFLFSVSLMIIVGMKVGENRRQLVKYSHELEMFNTELQRSEKMDIISELAASVAHEVRNPLQVTRGFLQLLDGKYSSPTDTTYVKLALNELDRASGIITDFLTFAKPGAEDVVPLNLANEFEQVENILQPLAHMQGGRLEISIPTDLHVLGNPSKFKQAIVNIVKNSIEAFLEDGLVEISARSNGEYVAISVKDNGEGMELAEISRLGEPYFSNKSKGTGLGLMVTFRIIEAMKGTIQFKSQKGKGTEAIIRLPVAPKLASVPE